MKISALFLLTLAALSAQTPPPHPAWNGDKVHEIRLRFAQADYWEKLTANYLGTEEQAVYLEASLEWGQYKFDSVGVRFKGNSSYRGAQTKKKPFRIKLNEFVKGQKIEGIGAFNLSNGWNDASLVREPPYYELATALGLKAPRTNYAALYINDQYWGLYVLGEVVNSDFLKNYFGKGEDTGNLYKANIGATFGYLGEDKATYKAVWEKQTNEDADDWSDLIELCRIIGQTPAAELKAKLEPLVDIDSVLTAIALDNATVNLDSYIGMGQNFNIYRRPSDNRWLWIVWDPSLAFGAFSQGGGGGQSALQLATEYVQAGGGPGGGIPGGGTNAGRPLATKLWQIPEYKERYRQIYKDIVSRVFLADKTVARMTALRAMIRPYVEADTQKLATLAQFDAAMTAAAIAGGGAPGLQPFVEGRLAWLKTQLDPQSFPTANLSASAASLNFAMGAGAANPAAQTVELRYSGVNTPPTFSLAAQTQSGGVWLTPSVTGGALPGSFQIAVNGKDLAAGVYAGAITVFLSGASEVSIPVTLTVGTLLVPAVNAIVNAASYNSGAIAPGQLATIFGTNLGPPTISADTAGVQVTFDGAAARLLYVGANQLGVIVPTAISGKTQTSVQVTYGAQASAAITKAVAPTAPGLFTTNASGSGPGAIINQTGSINSAAAPAAKGSIVAIYLTGAGLTNDNGALAAGATVTIGGQSATVAFAGAAPGSVQGLYQVNAAIPSNAASGALPIVVTIGGVASQSGVTISVQ
ncbi:MAG: CotH kinase family protein [Bryobacteraceae bacterium]